MHVSGEVERYARIVNSLRVQLCCWLLAEMHSHTPLPTSPPHVLSAVALTSITFFVDTVSCLIAAYFAVLKLANHVKDGQPL
jgi:hypothetical protein